MQDKENTLNKINKETKIFGMTTLELLLVSGVVFTPLLLSFYTIFVTIPITIVILNKFKKAAKAKCPNFLDEKSKELQIKKSYNDSCGIMKKL